LGRVTVATDAPIAPLTTLRLGGPAARLVEAHTEDELVDAVREADDAGEPVFVLAGGSNVVVADAGVAGTVVRVLTRGVGCEDLGEHVRLVVQAGEPWDDLVARTVADGLAGLECLSGIPGSTGATPIQNVGAYGQEVAATIERVRVWDRRARAVAELPAAECGFRYRSSRFKHSDAHVVLAVTFLLRRSPLSEPLRYPELARALGAQPGDRVPLEQARAAVLALRRDKGMVIAPDDPDAVSAGSFFTNPVLDQARFAALERRARARLGPGVHVPRYPEPDGRVKTSAAWVIEHAGFTKGLSRGAVGISTKHALALVNRGGARTEELVALAREIADGVRAAFGVDVVPEPVFVGHSWASGAGALAGHQAATPPTSMHRWVDHTAELQLELEAPTCEAVFAEAFAALRGLLADAGAQADGDALRRRVDVAAADSAALLAAWLEELVFLTEREPLVLDELADLQVGGDRVTATVRGRRGDSPPLVKAVTYHDLRLEREGECWRARVVLDV